MTIFTTSQSTAAGKAYASGVAREEISHTAIVAMTTAMIDNAADEVGLFWVPKGFVVTGITMFATDMDTNVTPALVFDVGDDSDEDRLIAATTTGQSAGSTTALASTGFLYKYTAKTLVKAYVKTAAATAAAGTLSVKLSGFVDEEFSTTALVGS